jgi:YVTN family beta-propeller protein
MKNKIFKISALLIVLMGTLSIISCSKSDTTASTNDNITYKAAYVINGTGNSISVIDLTTNEVKKTISLTDIGYPHHIAISPDKSKISIGVPGMDLSGGHSGIMAGMAGQFLVLNSQTGEMMKSQNLPAMCHNAIYSPDGTEIWAAQMEDAGKVLVYNASTYVLKNTINVGMMPLEVSFSSDGMMAFVCNSSDNSVTAINVSDKSVMATIPVGVSPVGAWQGGDNKMYVDNEDGQSISIINVGTMTVGETVTLGFMPGMAMRQNDMKELWVTDPTNGKVHWWTWSVSMNMYMVGGEVIVGAGAHAIAFNGMTAYVTNQTAGTVSVVDVNSHAVIKTITVGAKPNGIVLKL